MLLSHAVKNEKVGNDPWGDGRTLEWAISSPPPYYNFKQIPLVRGLDAYWIEKMEGKKELTPAEPLRDIHMPNQLLSFHLLSFRIVYCRLWCDVSIDRTSDEMANSMAIVVLIIGLLITFGSMLIRSMKDDHGYHIHKEDLMDDKIRGLRHNEC